MIILTIKVNAPPSAVSAVKECLAMQLEKFGDVRVSNVEIINDQTELENYYETKKSTEKQI